MEQRWICRQTKFTASKLVLSQKSIDFSNIHDLKKDFRDILPCLFIVTPGLAFAKVEFAIDSAG